MICVLKHPQHLAYIAKLMHLYGTDKLASWKDNVSYGPMKVKKDGVKIRYDKCQCCGLMKQGPLCRCTEDHLVCDGCKALVEPNECPVCVEIEIKTQRFETGRQFITHKYWEVPTTVLAIIVLFLEDAELLLYAHTFKEDPANGSTNHFNK